MTRRRHRAADWNRRRFVLGLVVLAAGFGVACSQHLWAGAALRDESFDPGSGPNGAVRAILVQPDRRVLVGGEFSLMDGTPCAGIARLEPDGRVDASYRGVAPWPVGRIEPLGDGRVLLVPVVSGTATYCTRLGPDGDTDPGFNPAAIQGYVGYARLAPDGGVWVAGSFASVEGDDGFVARTNLVRLTSNGSVDLGWTTGLHRRDRVDGLEPLPDGRLLAFGVFTNGLGPAVLGVVRFEADGSLDETFQPALAPTERVTAWAMQGDGRLLLAARNLAATLDYRLIRLFPDGNVDPSFAAELIWPDATPRTNMVTWLAVQPDGAILVSGSFLLANGLPRFGLARLDSLGRTDLCFDPGLGVAHGAIWAFAVQPDGAILVGGRDLWLEGQYPRHLARLRAASACDPPTVEFATPETWVEEASGVATVGVVRREGRLDACEVECHLVPGTAREGAEYVGERHRLSFAPGQRSASLRIPLVYDVPGGPEKHFWVRLVEVRGRGSLAVARAHRVTVVDAAARRGSGALDPAYRPVLPGPVTAAARRADGRLVVATESADRTTGPLESRVIGLLPDGRLDSGFVSTNVFDGHITSLLLLPDDHCLVGGGFSGANGLPCPALVRLRSDGVVDGTFEGLRPGQTQGSWAPSVQGLNVDVRGDVIAVGSVVVSAEGERLERRSWLRLGTDGSWDTGFAQRSDPCGFGLSLARITNGRLLASTAEGLREIGADGAVDPRFVPPAIAFRSPVLVGTPDGHWLVTSEGRSVPPAAGSLLRLNPEGSEDPGFVAPRCLDDYGLTPERLAVSADPLGRVLVGGGFTRVNGLPRAGLVRLHPDGAVDWSFDPGLGLSGRGGRATEVRVLLGLPDGGWIVGGDFGGVAGIDQPYLARIDDRRSGRPNALHCVAEMAEVEEGSGPAVVWVYRTGDATEEATVQLRMSVRALDETEELRMVDHRIRLAPGQWAFRWELPVPDDTVAAPDRQFVVALLEPSAGWGLGTSQALVTVREDDVNVGLAESLTHASEEAGYVVVPVRRWGAAGGAVSARLRVGEMEAPVEFPARTSAVSFTNLVRVPLLDNAERQGEWEVEVELTSPSQGAVLGTPRKGVIRVTDADYPSSPAYGVAGEVRVVVPGPGGTVYLGGEFTAVHGVPRRNVARLLPDGQVDPGFDPGVGPDGMVTALAVSEHGLVIAGEFHAVSNVPRARIARLFSTGLLDPAFLAWPGPSAGTNTVVIRSLAIQPDGCILVGGEFSRFNGLARSGLVRLMPDGPVDLAFMPALEDGSGILFPFPGVGLVSSSVNDLWLDPTTGSVVVQGVMFLASQDLLRPQCSLVRLLPDGAIDPSFRPETASGRLRLPSTCMAGLRDGRLVVGYTTTVSPWLGQPTTAWLGMGLKATNGLSLSLRVTGLPSLGVRSSTVRKIIPLEEAPQGFLVLADVTTTNLTTTNCSLVLRLHASGAWDGTFPILAAPRPPPVRTGLMGPVSPEYPGSGDFDLPAAVADLAVEPDGVVVLGGRFLEVDGVPRRGLARVSLAGGVLGRMRLTPGFATEGGAFRVWVEPGNEAPYALQRSTQLEFWESMGTNSAPWEGWEYLVPFSAGDREVYFRAVALPLP